MTDRTDNLKDRAREGEETAKIEAISMIGEAKLTEEMEEIEEILVIGEEDMMIVKKTTVRTETITMISMTEETIEATIGKSAETTEDKIDRMMKTTTIGKTIETIETTMMRMMRENIVAQEDPEGVQ